MKKEKCCENCKNRGDSSWICCNVDSEYCAEVIFPDDTCEFWEGNSDADNGQRNQR